MDSSYNLNHIDGSTVRAPMGVNLRLARIIDCLMYIMNYTWQAWWMYSVSKLSRYTSDLEEDH